MAESVITFVLSNVNSLLTREAELLLGVDDQIRSVRNQLEWIHSILNDANQKRHKNQSEKVWVNQIRDVAYELEDTIDVYILKLERHWRRNLAMRFLCNSKKLKTMHMMGTQLREIKARFDEISANRTNYGLEDIQPRESSSSSTADNAPKEKRAPIVEEADVVGFDDDAEKLAKALLRGGSLQRTVVSITGMGGLGKTTLAKYVYTRRDVKEWFHISAWIYISQEYKVRDLLLSMVKQVMVPLTRKQEKEMETLSGSNLRQSCMTTFIERDILLFSMIYGLKKLGIALRKPSRMMKMAVESCFLHAIEMWPYMQTHQAFHTIYIFSMKMRVGSYFARCSQPAVAPQTWSIWEGKLLPRLVGYHWLLLYWEACYL